VGSININLLWMIAGTLAALIVGTAIRLLALRNSAADVVNKRLGSLKVWWVLALLWSVAALIGLVGATALVAIASFLALREYLRLIGTSEQIGRAAIGCLIVGGIAHYLLIVGGSIEVAKWFLPISLLLLFGAIRATAYGIEGYIRTTAGLYWGAMLMIYGLSHSLFLFDVDTGTKPVVGAAGWFLFLVMLSEMNDIMQAIVGRKIGKHKITPLVSPKKTYEGLAGGLITCAGLSVLLAPYLTTITNGRSTLSGIALSVLAGLLISVAGFLGDINMSAIKRDAGVKDGSALLPGMGGMIDRIDSLTFTGPVFYYFVMFLSNQIPKEF
jgi:phosphatidate cytidylyltransferase